MSNQPSLDEQIAAVRAFATTTEQATKILNCSYVDAAEFLIKLGPFIIRLNDADFRAKLDLYCKTIAQNHPQLTLVPKPIDRSVH
jgi:hypothetical protein